ncbi:MAG: hypothetical protein ACRD96_04575 [Bryobacteraceae bacterium]
MKKWIVALVPALALAQEPQDRLKRVEVLSQGIAVGGPNSALPHVMQFVSSEFEWNDKVVKNAPYSADAVTESIQNLADGNRIVHKNTAKVYRDAEGRTRREQNLEGIGPFAANEPHQTIVINDPVAGVNYIVNPNNKSARKVNLGKLRGGAPFNIRLPEPPSGEQSRTIINYEAGAASGGGNVNSRSESLGTRNIEGLIAEGTRTTITIPAGQMGNEKPIEVVNERWYSNELGLVVLSRRNDPRFGETVYQLNNVSRSAPERSLFDPPAGFNVEEGNLPFGGEIRMHRKIEGSHTEAPHQDHIVIKKRELL